MSSSDPVDPLAHAFRLDARDLTAAAVNGVRIAFGVAGVIGIIFGIVLLVWPGKTLGVLAVFLGIYFLVSGIMRLALGIFSRGIKAGHRILDILLGLLLVIAGIFALRNLATAAAALLIVLVVVIGIGWIIEGVLAIVESRGSASQGWAIATGVISIIAGIVVLAIPGWSALWLLVFAGVLLIVLGILGVIRAFTFGRSTAKAPAADSPRPAP